MGNSKLQSIVKNIFRGEVCSHFKQKCVDRYWTGYLHLCKELQHRSEAFSAICQLDDITLLEEPDGKPAAMKLLMQTLVKKIYK